MGKIRSGYWLALFLLLASYFLVIYSIIQLQKKTKRMEHSFALITHLNDLTTKLNLAESSVNRYVLSKNSADLDTYHSTLSTIPFTYNDLKKFIATDHKQSSRLDTLINLIREKLDFFSISVELVSDTSIKKISDIDLIGGKNLIAGDSIQLYVEKMINNEQESIEDNKSTLANAFQSTIGLIIASLFIAIIVVIYLFFTYIKVNRAKRFSDTKVNEYDIGQDDNVQELKERNYELTELKNFEKFAATGRVARMIAHELRNPLTNISLAAEQLKEMNIPNDDSSMLLDMINRNAIRINQLVSDLLSATKYVQLIIQKRNINELLDETLEMAKDRIDLNHIKVEKKYSADICDISVDAEKIKIAFLNIIVNAIEAMENDKGILELITKKAGNKCIVEIRDNGIGMDEDTVQKVFEAFFTGKPNGTGLGLTNSQNIILSHKGKVKVYSQPFKGTSFVIILDIA
jgi:signal transduction histidine kinase